MSKNLWGYIIIIKWNMQLCTTTFNANLVTNNYWPAAVNLN